MKIKLYSKVTNPNYLSDIRQLLILCDDHFVPPLSSRESTTQSDLSPKEKKSVVPEKYFKTISGQSAILAIHQGRVIGFMSYCTDYVCEHISKAFSPNIYVTTVVVHPDQRNRGVAGRLYDKLLKQFPRRYIFTRTWSTNDSHIRILRALGFHEHDYLDNDRGKGIDTIYYRLQPARRSLGQYVAQYHLGGNISFFILLVVSSAIFLGIWFNTGAGILHELALAIATSLMASLLCLGSDIFIKLHDSKTDAYINKLKSFGIENLQFNKNEILENIIPKCRNEIWISGYRLIMTGQPSFRRALVTACRRSRQMKIKILATPPWTETYRLTYGSEDVSMNYIRILRDLLECTRKDGLKLEVHFTEKPIFNDTYKVDDRFITGPYLHCADRYNNRITAKDFFSLDISDPQKDLYQIIYQDYMTLWKEATVELDLDRFAERLERAGDPGALSPEERLSLLRDSCVARNVTAV